ncbi:MAG: metallophosphoesterase [Peptococcaceae bacterium]|nr:metallophosphoesterase [Peptococcaceae bacterium]
MKKLLVIISVVVILLLFCLWQNNSIVISRYEYTSNKVSPALNGLRIVHLSDLHNKDFKGRLSSSIKEQQPDLIVISGDLIDGRRTDLDIALKLVQEVVQLAPVYFVTGNHEEKSNMYQELHSRLKACGVKILIDQATVVEFQDCGINIIGLRDPIHYKQLKASDVKEQQVIMRRMIQANMAEDMLNILLVHRPEFFALYAECNIDLAFTGHAHGGQIRLPLVGGLLAPGQGLFPKYTSGLHTLNNSSMVISRGLGNSVFPQRLFNRPEVVVVTLKHE